MYDSNFPRGQGWWHLWNPLPLWTTFAFTHPCFKMFLERSLNDPPPPHFKHLSLLPPSPSTTPSPLTILIIHHMLITNCSLNLSEYFPGMKFCFWHFSFSSRYCRLMHTEKQTLKSLDMHVEFNIFPHWK